ncbi:MAG: hypothetical protein GWN00_29675, partial [Aliifodinibius sp.]|nr:hypothetical protein [Fodinibius sp.]NIW47909.1 hypothetical protein [Gammaproteobacteria bacterium]NIY28809.1 hypothetical protein [Fodinibius sp.]
MFPDEVFFISDIYSVGDYDIEKAGLTFWIADIVGGDALDDTLAYDLSKQVVYFCDSDGIGSPPFGNDTVGVAALAFIQTPFVDFPQNQTEVSISNIQQDPAFNIDFNTVSDQFLWTKFMTPGSFYVPNPMGEYDPYVSISYFPLPAGQSQRLITAMVFGQDIIEIDNKIDFIKTTFRGMTGGPPNTNVSVLSPAPGQVVSGQAAIEWDAENNNPAFRISILFSEDFAESWKPLAYDLPNTGIYQWDTTNQPDGIF